MGWPTAGTIVRDVLLCLLMGAGVAVEALANHWNQGLVAAGTWVMAGLALTSVIIVLSRLYPLVALLLSLAAVLWLTWFSFLLTVVAYLVGRRMPRLRPALVVMGAVTLLGLCLLLLLWTGDVNAWTVATLTLVFNLVLPWLVGVYRRQHVELATAGWERARQLEREQRLTAEQARLRERSRIAQDMHDSLGHELSLIALRAGALELASDLEERHRRAAGELRATATTATDRLREIIGVLRADAEPAPMAPADEGVSALVERARASGMEVLFEREGEPAVLPPMVDRAVYRLVQESLTNATKHAPGAAVTVRLAYTEDTVAVRVANAAPPAGPLPGHGGGNRGLIGLRERVRLAGGSFRAQEWDGGWEVRADLPISGDGVAAPADEEGGTGAPEWSETEHLHRQARRRVRWGMIALVGLPMVCAFLLLIAAGGAYTYTVQRQVLPAEDYAALRTGQSRESVEARLPREQVDTYLIGAEPPRPEGAECGYYRGRGSMFVVFDVYRLCFTDGRLASKDVISVD